MPIAINGSGTVTGISVGGLPDGIVDADMLASNAVTAGKLASGVGGKILQVVQTVKSDITSTTSTSYGDISGMSVAITPSNASNKILVTANFSAVATEVLNILLTRGDNTVIIQGDAAGGVGGGTQERVSVSIYAGGNSSGSAWYGGESNTIIKLDTPNTTNAVTYKLRWKTYNGTGYLNRNMDMDNPYNVLPASTITAMEVAA